jgi:hypothetical protein
MWICVIEFHKGNVLSVEQTDCTYWQSVTLLVEQTEMNLLTVCQALLLNRLKCTYR